MNQLYLTFEAPRVSQDGLRLDDRTFVKPGLEPAPASGLPGKLLEAGSMNRDELLDLLRTHKAIL